MRVVKEYDERKNEIIDTAAFLFMEKGYDRCSVNDILNKIGIAKGTFYHYFKSKEDVLDAAVDKMSEQITMLTPIFAEIVEEGNTAGIFHCAYPAQSAQILLAATLTLLDDGIFQIDKTEAAGIFEALIAAMEKMLGVADGALFEKMHMYWQF